MATRTDKREAIAAALKAAGASLAVRRSEQGDVAGKIASVNGAAYIFAPAVGVALFNWWEPATFIMIGAALLFLIIWGRRSLNEAL